MAVSIARRPIATPKAGAIARRQVASRFGQVDVGYSASFPPRPGSGNVYTFTPPKPGFYKFVQWGGGGSGDGTGAGGSGAYTETTAFMSLGDKATITVGRADQNTTVVLPDGRTITAGAGIGGGAGGTGGVATGGDINLSGSAAGVAGLGSGGGLIVNSGSSVGGGAPAVLPFRGGDGQGSINFGTGPGGGGWGPSATNTQAAAGLAIAVFVRD